MEYINQSLERVSKSIINMLSYRSGGVTSILLLLFSDICFALSVCKSKHHTKQNGRRRITAMLFVKNKGSDIDITSNDHEQDKNISDRIRRQRRRRNIKHNIESQTTTAGVEQLFSLSLLWSSFITRRIQNKKRQVSSTEDTIIISSNQEDLPSIDCKQLCNSIEEEIQLQQMKALLESDMQSIIERGLHKTSPDVYGDLRLLRFLRKSKERDVVSAADRYRSFLVWREEYNVDKIRSTISEDISNFTPLDTKLQRVASYFPMNFDDMIGESNTTSYDDTAFQPSAILYIGAFDTKGISSEIKSTQSDISLQDFLDYWIYIYESIHYHLYQQSIQCGDMIRLDEVCDLEGLAIQQFSPYFVTKVMKPWLTLTQQYYPETTRRIIVLNSPSIINVAWNLVTPLLSQGTVDKICFEERNSS